MYFVEIDISKHKHDCHIVDETNKAIRDSFSFDNDKERFSLEYFSHLIVLKKSR